MSEFGQTPPRYQPPPQYGQQQYGPPQYGQPVYTLKKPSHTPSLVLGIISLATLWFTIGISGIVCGILAVALSRKNKFEYSTKAGFVMGLIGLIAGIIFLICAVLVIIVLSEAFEAAFGEMMGSIIESLRAMG